MGIIRLTKIEEFWTDRTPLLRHVSNINRLTGHDSQEPQHRKNQYKEGSMGSAHMPKRALIGALLIANMLTATRLSFSIQPLVRRSSYSLISPKHFSKSRPCPLWSSSFSFCLQNPHRSPTCPSIVPFSSHCPAPSMATVPQSTPEVNPLLLDFDFPPFDAVKADHVIPGIRTMLNQLVRFL